MSEVHLSPNLQKSGRRGRPRKQDVGPDARQEVGSQGCAGAEPLRDPMGLVRNPKLMRAVNLASSWSIQPVDRRWQIASAIADGLASRRLFREQYDEYIAHAVAYLKSFKACQNDADRDRLSQKMSHMHQARLIRESPGKFNRGILEARLLVGQSIEATAAACNLPPETVRLYEALFFAVVGIKRRHYLMLNAIGSKCWDGLLEEDVDVILKMIGLQGGLIMLEEAIRYYTSSWQVPERLEALTKAELIELHAMIETEALILVWVLPFEKCQRVIRLQALGQELQALIDALPDLGAGASEPVRVDLTAPSVNKQLSWGGQQPAVENTLENAAEPAEAAA